MPTRKDYFELLPFEQQEKYKAEYLRQNKKPTFEQFLKGGCNSMAKFLSNGFVFDMSVDGYFYWYELSNKNMCLPEWVNVYYNKVDTSNPDKLVVKSGCEFFRLPNMFADAIAEDLLLKNLITNYIIHRPEIKEEVFFEDNNQ